MSRSPVSSRNTRICGGFLFSLGLVLMAFEYRVPFPEPESTELKGEVLSIEMEEVKAVEKPEPGKEEEKKEVDPAKRPEPVDEKKEEQEEELDEEELRMGEFGEEEEADEEMRIPEYIPDEPLAEYELGHYAYFSSCKGKADPEARLACTKAKLVEELKEKTDYPEMLRDMDIEGSLSVSFVVEEDGGIGEIRVLNSPHPLFSKEVKKAVRKLPPFEPARKKGHPVKMHHSAPVSFKLR